MATETAPAPVNGSYAHADSSYEAPSAPSSSNSGHQDIPKDEVGWYFVEQYYTTLSRTPDKLYLFYNKRSQFVQGVEEEKVSVCIGQKAINERIKELEFQDCKVRITNVDSQASDASIVIQVIGEISNKQAPHRKFVQTFVLATQANGYFVLNDIFRYIIDEEPEAEGEELPQEVSGQHEPVHTAAEPENVTPETASKEVNVEKVDEQLEEVIQNERAPPAQVNGTPVPEEAEVAEAEEAPVAAVSAPEETAAPEPAAEEPKEVEKPKEPEAKIAIPTPKASPAPPAVPAAAPKPAAPKTWASLAASAHRVVTPVIPAAQATTPAQTKPVPATQAPAPTPAVAASQPPAQPAREPSPANSGSEGWQTAGQEHTKRQSRTQNQAASNENAGNRAYIKNVYESVDADALKKELSKYGEIAYFDVSRQKNCAFVDFATVAGFQAAVNANPHTVGDNQIFVEERRLRPQSFGGFQRGGGAPRGRGDRPVGQGRGGFNRGRGGANTTRGGRGQAA